MKLDIDISNDIEQYKENIIMGFNMREVIYGLLSVIVGAVIILLLIRQNISSMIAMYISIPVVTPIALCGFYKKNGMYFDELIKLILENRKINKELYFISSEEEEEINRLLNEKNKNQEKQIVDEKKKLLQMIIAMCTFFVVIVITLIIMIIKK